MGLSAENANYREGERVDIEVLGGTGAEKWVLADEAAEVKESSEGKLGRVHNVLNEVDLLRRRLYRNRDLGRWEVDTATREYVFENELTAACEAVDSGGYLWFSHRQWDDENEHFLAYGRSFLRMLEMGTEHVQRKCGELGYDQCGFELERREAEMDQERQLTRDYKKGMLYNRLLLTISPFPEEAEDDNARGQGYRPAERIGKLRFEVFSKGARQTAELSVANSSMDIFKRLLETLGIDNGGLNTSLDLLRQRFDLAEADDPLGTILKIVKRYDALLEAEHNHSEDGENSSSLVHYFCGREVERETDKRYDGLIERQKWVREKGTELIGRVYNLDFELAVSLRTGEPTKVVMESLEYWSKLRDGQGERALSSEALLEIRKSLASKRMSREAAFVLKKNELLRTWSMMACALNERRARDLFGDEAVEQVRRAINSGRRPVTEQDLLVLVDHMVATAQPQYPICGGVIGEEEERGGRNLYRMFLGEARSRLFSNGMKEFFEWVCAKCGHKHSINVFTGDLKEKCENCGASGNCGWYLL